MSISIQSISRQELETRYAEALHRKEEMETLAEERRREGKCLTAVVWPLVALLWCRDESALLCNCARRRDAFDPRRHHFINPETNVAYSNFTHCYAGPLWQPKLPPRTEEDLAVSMLCDPCCCCVCCSDQSLGQYLTAPERQEMTDVARVAEVAKAKLEYRNTLEQQMRSSSHYDTHMNDLVFSYLFEADLPEPPLPAPAPVPVYLP